MIIAKTRLVRFIPSFLSLGAVGAMACGSDTGVADAPSESLEERRRHDAGVVPATDGGAQASSDAQVTPPSSGGPGASLGGGTSTSCVFMKADQPANIAFCDGFDAIVGKDPNSRSGDLNATLWGVSRTNTMVNPSQGEYNDFYAATLQGCGAPQKVLPPNDVRICNGRIVEAAADNGGQSTIAIYPKQPFDIAGRTGTVVFDVSSDAEGPHAAWPEFWYTDQPVPAPGDSRSGQAPYARNSFGFVMSNNCGVGQTAISGMFVTRNYVLSELPFTSTYGQNCIKNGSVAGALNHFEVRISQSLVEVWATDAGSTTLKLLGRAENANLTLTKGLLWMEDAHYNGCKFDHQCDHTFAWDNFGFDGPKTYRDLAFDVKDALTATRDGAGSIALAYPIGVKPTSLTVPGVFRKQTPTATLVTFNWFPMNQQSVPSFRLNGGPWHDTAWPFDGETYKWRTIGVTAPVAEMHDGDNTIEFKNAEDSALSNVNAILVAGAAVP